MSPPVKLQPWGLKALLLSPKTQILTYTTKNSAPKTRSHTLHEPSPTPSRRKKGQPLPESLLTTHRYGSTWSLDLAKELGLKISFENARKPLSFPEASESDWVTTSKTWLNSPLQLPNTRPTYKTLVSLMDYHKKNESSHDLARLFFAYIEAYLQAKSQPGRHEPNEELVVDPVAERLIDITDLKYGDVFTVGGLKREDTNKLTFNLEVGESLEWKSGLFQTGLRTEMQSLSNVGRLLLWAGSAQALILEAQHQSWHKCSGNPLLHYLPIMEMWRRSPKF